MEITSANLLQLHAPDDPQLTPLAHGHASFGGVLFLVLPPLLRAGIAFLPALLISSGIMAATYALYTVVLRSLGVKI